MTSPPTLPEDLTETAVRFLDAVLSAADADVIGVANWWNRAQAALETAATAASYPEAVAEACRKLQVTWALPEPCARQVIAIGADVADPARFAAWREHCARDFVYITALARIRRAERRQERTAS